MPHTYQPHKQSGFTLVEMLVVAPLVVLVIGTIVGFLVSLVGNVLISNARSQAQYATQDALDQIEQDAFWSGSFYSTFTAPSPQGENDATQPFTSTSGSGTDLIFHQVGVTTRPTDPARSPVFFANRPAACGSGSVQTNETLFVKTIYFVKAGSLYRRVVVPPNNQNVTPDAQTTCAAPWQRNSCTSIGLAAQCISKDSKLVDNVSAFSVTYYNKNNPSITLADPTLADSLTVSITTTKIIAGESVSDTLYVATSRTNNTP